MGEEKVDPKIWEHKDRLIVAQSSLKTAVDLLSNRGVTVGEVLDCADVFFDWVYLQAEGKANGNKAKSNETKPAAESFVKTELPTATVKQQEWLDKIFNQYGFTKEQVWEKCKTYPSNKEEAIEITRKMKG